jgi:hypothetical protein
VPQDLPRRDRAPHDVLASSRRSAAAFIHFDTGRGEGVTPPRGAATRTAAAGGIAQPLASPGGARTPGAGGNGGSGARVRRCMKTLLRKLARLLDALAALDRRTALRPAPVPVRK